MTHRSLWLFVGVVACGGVDTGELSGGPTRSVPEDAEADATTSGSTDAGSDVFSIVDSASDAPSDTGPGGPCPAPALAGNETLIFGDGTTAGWSLNGFQGPVSTAAAACSGTSSASYTSKLYDGFGFNVNSPAGEIDAASINYRIYVDRDAVVSVAASPRTPVNDIHTYFLLPQAKWAWKKGWNVGSFDIPVGFGKTGNILFEVQSCSAPACSATSKIEFRVDDVRLVAR